MRVSSNYQIIANFEKAEKMNAGGAYGGGKAGASFDLVTFVQRPQVILRGCCWVSVSSINFKIV